MKALLHLSSSKLEKLQFLSHRSAGGSGSSLPSSYRHQQPTPQATPRSSVKWLYISLVICSIAFAASAYLAWMTATSSEILGCTGDGVFSCDDVLKTQWSRAFGIPVSYWAIAMHGCGMASILVALANRRVQFQIWGWRTLTFVAISSGLAAIWFVGIQIFAIGKFCSYCLVVHGCGVGLATLAFSVAPINRYWKLGLGSLAAIGFSIMLIGQVFFAAPSYRIEELEAPTDTSPAELFAPPSAGRQQRLSNPPLEIANIKSNPATILLGIGRHAKRHSPLGFRRIVGVTSAPSAIALAIVQSTSKADPPRRMVSFPSSGSGGSTSLDSRRWPILGDPDAKYICVEMFDYTCPHCRATQPAIQAIFQKYGRDFALIALPVPLNRQCNGAVQVTEAAHKDACKIAELAIDHLDRSTCNSYRFLRARSLSRTQAGATGLRSRPGTPVAAYVVRKRRA